MNDLAIHSSSGLAARTLRTVGVLVAACVIFVGVLSVVAVVVTSRAVGAGAPPGVQATDTPASAATGTSGPKKPLSI